ncbi:MAG: hypothetical protein WD232_08665 [Acidimicrobiales bacterium]
MQMRNCLGPLLATLVLVASCGGDDEDASPTTTDAPATSAVTTTTEAVDPFTVPDDPADITEEYVEAVINEHNRVIGDALRIQLEGGDPKEIIDRYNAIYVPEVADRRLTAAFDLDEELVASLKQPLGDQIFQVVSLDTAKLACVKAVVEQDLSAVFKEPPAPTQNVLVLRAAEAATGHNRTRWMSEGLVPIETAGEVQC